MSYIVPSRGKVTTHLLESFPKELFVAVFDILKAVYLETSASEVNQVSGYRRRLVVGVKRFAYAEERVLKIASMFRGRDIEIVEVKGYGGAIHVEIRAGRFILTLAYVKKPDRFVRFSKYREGLALQYQQALFPDLTKEPTGAEYYGILIHG
ncbi:MAG: hypothetical protein AAFQ53_05765, partial [Bacteroidota bacterium]